MQTANMKIKILFLFLLASFVVNGQTPQTGIYFETALINWENLPNKEIDPNFKPTKSAYVDPEVKRLIQGLKNDYQYQIDQLKLRIESLENSNNDCNCCQYELTYYDIGQMYEWIDENGVPHQLTIPELYVELPEACVGAKAIIFMYDYTLYLEYTAQDGWLIVKAVRASY